MKGFRVVFTIAALMMLMGAVSPALASPITANLTWSSQTLTPGSSNTATFGVSVDSDCPSGQTFSGTLTVVEPDGISTSTVTVGATPCGTTNLTAVYPTAFTGVAGTTELGTYSATWAGTTSATIGGVHPTFKVTDNFVVASFPPPVPEFPVPAIMVVGAAMLLMGLIRRTSVKTPAF